MRGFRFELRARVLLAVVVMGVLLVGAVGSTLAASHPPASAGRPLTAMMTGPAEVPPGDPDGTGVASIWVNPGQSRVCWQISVKDITLPATGAHIHKGGPGAAGPIVVPLSAPGANGTSSGCTSVDRGLAQALIQDPAAYYVNVHNADFPGGAVRGPLGKGHGASIAATAAPAATATATPTPTPTATPTATAAPANGTLQVIQVVTGSTSGFGGGTFTYHATCGTTTTSFSIVLGAGSLTGSTSMSVPSGTSCTVVETGFPSGTSLGSPVYVPSTGTVSIDASATSTVAVINVRA